MMRVIKILPTSCALLLALTAASLSVPVAAQEARLSRMTSKSDLREHTKQIILLWEKYLKSSSGDRQEILNSLRELVAQRASGLASLAQTRPEALFEFSLPEEIRETLPRELQAQIEYPIKVSGIIEKDPSPEPGASDTFPYQIRDPRGRKFELVKIGADLLIAEGATVEISGIAFNNKLIFKASNSSSFRQVSTSFSDREPPYVSITYPSNGQIVHEDLLIQVLASDNQSVTHIELFHDGNLLTILNSQPYEYQWSTRDELDGPHTLMAKAYDPDLNISGTQNHVVQIDNTPPQIQWSFPLPNSNLSDTVQFSVQAHDNIGLQSIKFLVDGEVTDVVVSPPYTASWDSTAHANGPVQFEAIAIDQAGNISRTAPISGTLLNSNETPILNPIEDKTVNEGTSLHFTLQAHDPDGPKDPLGFSAENLPEWMSLNPNTGDVFGTPPFDVANQAEPIVVFDKIVFQACDSQPLCSSQPVNIHVHNVNHPPTMSNLPDIEIAEGATFEVKPIIFDIDNDPYTCTIKRRPVFAEFNETDCILKGTVPYSLINREIGRHAISGIRIQACDPKDNCAASEFDLTINHVNQKPTMELIRDQTIREGREIKISFKAEDADADPLVFSVQDLPEGARFYDYGAGTAELTWMPATYQAGSYPITISVSDGEFADSQVFAIHVKEHILAFTGRVTDDLNHGVAGVSIEYSRTGDAKKRVMTDASGYYSVEDIPPGTYLVKPQFGLRENLPTSGIIHFKPMTQRIDLRSTDQRNINFIALGLE